MPFVLLLSLLFTTRVFAQDEPQTDPVVAPHPTTGEPGVWTPRWLQRIHLQTDAELQVCLKSTTLTNQQLDTLNAETAALRSATTELKLGLEASQKDAAATRLLAQDTERKARRRLIWGVSSTSAAVVALLVLTLVGAL